MYTIRRFTFWVLSIATVALLSVTTAVAIQTFINQAFAGERRPLARFASHTIAYATEAEAMQAVMLQIMDETHEYCGIIIEYNGQLSVIRQDWAEAVQKADVGLAMEEQKRADTGGDDEPMPEHRTESPELLDRAE